MAYQERKVLTPNYTPWRTNKKEGVVFHHTGGSFNGAVTWLTSPESKVSAHVVIARDGERAILAEDDWVTWHAGRGELRGTNPNYITLGVEFELTPEMVSNNINLTEAQLSSMLEWLRPRWEKYGWTIEDMTHHRAVDPERKTDLSPADWHLVQTAILEELLLVFIVDEKKAFREYRDAMDIAIIAYEVAILRAESKLKETLNI